MKSISAWPLIKESISDWFKDDAPQLAAALAYYTIFSIAPLLIISIAIAGVAFGESAVQGQVVAQLKGVMGEDAAVVIQSMIQGVRQSPKTLTATIMSIAVLLLGATAVVGQLKSALNTVWDVPPQSGSGLKGMIKSRFLSFLIVLGIGLLLLASLIVSTTIAALKKYAGTLIVTPAATSQVLDFLVSFAVLTLLFAMLYKFLPDVRIAWSDVWIGGAVTALLFNVGKYAIGFYLARAAPASTYGAAGSVIVILLWIYYSSLIVLLGAEFTQVYATRYGSRIGYSAAAPRKQVESPGNVEKKTMETTQSETQYLENETYRAKEAIKRTMRDLGSTVQEAANPREWPAQFRWIALGTMVLAGATAGTRMFMRSRKTTAGRRHRPSRERISVSAPSDGHEGIPKTMLTSVLAAAGGVLAGVLQTALKSAVSSAVSSKTSPRDSNVPH